MTSSSNCLDSHALNELSFGGRGREEEGAREGERRDIMRMNGHATRLHACLRKRVCCGQAQGARMEIRLGNGTKGPDWGNAGRIRILRGGGHPQAAKDRMPICLALLAC